MKKLIFISLITVLSGSLPGQSSLDYILKSRAMKESGKTDSALILLNNAVNEVKDSRLFIERSEIFILKANYTQSLSDLNEANKLTPGSGEYGLSLVYALKGDAVTSLYHLELNLRSSFKKSEKEIMLNQAFSGIENRSEWRQFWKRDWYTPAETGISEIEYNISAGKIDESKSVLAELRKGLQNDDNVLYAESLINLASGKYAEVIKVVSGLINLHPADERFLRILAKAQSGSGNPAGASVTYTQLLNSGVADAGLFMLRAESYRRTGETDKASTDIKKYLSYYPDNKSALSLAGKIESAAGDNIKALEYFSENVKLHPHDAECYIDRANAYFVSKSWNWAINDYAMSLDLNPGNPEAWLNKGIALLNSGKTDDACHDFKESYNLGNKKAAEYISRNCIK